MKIVFEDLNDEVIYRIYDVEPKYENILQMCFYQKDGRGYIKKYPKNAKYLDKMKKRYYQNAQRMFDQLGYFCDVPWEKGLKKFCSMVQDSNINWWLTGSCAACIRGVELNPHDIDIMIDSKSVAEITELFKDYLIEPIINTNGWLTKDFGVIFMDVRIDIASDPSPVLDEPEPVDCGPFALNHLEVVNWNGFQIKVPPLDLQLNVNRKRGRMDRVKKMEEFLHHGN
ncbi:nucleotidyltransferase domain-containing protein [Tindallia californiensis]|uniref:Uncharacterized protein n=1 Tax=Tindallia californiensis TaxID=159292 RepID=A0A1H3PQG9_9FIRM|nr:hypothetical protein [Tindallia californiensis]SDZ03512.1 hypothetical protein SAMN05192546_10739 [Tindallia californiensis]